MVPRVSSIADRHLLSACSDASILPSKEALAQKISTIPLVGPPGTVNRPRLKACSKVEVSSSSVRPDRSCRISHIRTAYLTIIINSLHHTAPIWGQARVALCRTASTSWSFPDSPSYRKLGLTNTTYSPCCIPQPNTCLGLLVRPIHLLGDSLVLQHRGESIVFMRFCFSLALFRHDTTDGITAGFDD